MAPMAIEKKDFDWGGLVTSTLPALITAGSSLFANSGAAAAADDKLAFTAEQAALDRQATLDQIRLRAELAGAGGGGGGGGGGGAAAMEANKIARYALLQKAYDSYLQQKSQSADRQSQAFQQLAQGAGRVLGGGVR